MWTGSGILFALNEDVAVVVSTRVPREKKVEHKAKSLERMFWLEKERQRDTDELIKWLPGRGCQRSSVQKSTWCWFQCRGWRRRWLRRRTPPAPGSCRPSCSSALPPRRLRSTTKHRHSLMPRQLLRYVLLGFTGFY